MNLIKKTELENVLLSNWANFIDKTQLIKTTLEKTSFTNFRKLSQDKIPAKNLKIQITKFEPKTNYFLVWIEFSVPKENGVVIGEHEAELTLSGELKIIETNGTHFVIKQH